MKTMEAILIIALVVILIFAIIGICAAAVMVWGQFRHIETTRYERRLAAEQAYDTALVREAKVMIVGKMAFIPKGVTSDNEIIYDRAPIDDTGTPMTANIIDGTAMDKQRSASNLVNDSIKKKGGEATQLLTEREWEDMGHAQEDHHDALTHLYNIGLIDIKNGGKKQGTFVKSGTLQDLMLDLAVYALPLATGQKIQKS